MPVIRISDQTFKTLQSLAIPLVDTPGTVIDRLVSDYLSSEGIEPDGPPDAHTFETRDFDSLDPPGLTHTKPLTISVDGNRLDRPRWSACLIGVIKALTARGYSGQDLIDRLNVPASLDEATDGGFKYYPALGISVQGQSAQDAWKEIARLAVQYSIPVEVAFQWRAKQGAEYPGQKGRMVIGP